VNNIQWLCDEFEFKVGEQLNCKVCSLVLEGDLTFNHNQVVIFRLLLKLIYYLRIKNLYKRIEEIFSELETAYIETLLALRFYLMFFVYLFMFFVFAFFFVHSL
jgi:hypothetical protein